MPDKTDLEIVEDEIKAINVKIDFAHLAITSGQLKSKEAVRKAEKRLKGLQRERDNLISRQENEK